MIFIDDNHKNIIVNILARFPYTFFAFGSRTKEIYRKLSDLDLCYFAEIPWNILSHIEEEFQESDLPFEVDLVSWLRCDEEFRKIIASDLTCIHRGDDFNIAQESLAPYLI